MARSAVRRACMAASTTSGAWRFAARSRELEPLRSHGARGDFPYIDRMPSPLPHELCVRAPKAVLHDHLDGGLRPETVVELAREFGYTDLPRTDVAELAAW